MKIVVKEPKRPWSQELGADPGRLRIAIHTDSWSTTPVDPEVAAAVEAVGRQLEQLGHRVERATPSFEWETFIAAQVPLIGASFAGFVEELAEASGGQPGPETLEQTILTTYEYGRRLTALEVGRAMRTVNTIMRTFGAFFAEWDLLLTPTMNVPPLPLGYHDANDASFDAEGWTRHVFDPCSFTPVFNWTGGPAVSLPLGWTSDGLPIGVQLAAPMCEEATLIQVGSQLEEAMPWRDRRPPVHAAGSLVANAL